MLPDPTRDPVHVSSLYHCGDCPGCYTVPLYTATAELFTYFDTLYIAAFQLAWPSQSIEKMSLLQCHSGHTERWGWMLLAEDKCAPFDTGHGGLSALAQRVTEACA